MLRVDVFASDEGAEYPAFSLKLGSAECYSVGPADFCEVCERGFHLLRSL